MNTAVGICCLVSLAFHGSVADSTRQQLSKSDRNEGNLTSLAFRGDDLEQRNLVTCVAKDACTDLGGKCQSKTINCPGVIWKGSKYCKKANKCGCCVPDGDPCEELASEFRKLGNAPITAIERRRILAKLLHECPGVGAQLLNWHDRIERISGAKAAVCSLKQIPVTPGITYLPFYGVTSIPALPHKIFLKLQHKDTYLGDIIITLDGEIFYPRLAQQMYELFTGDNKAGGSMRGVGFPWIYNYDQPAEYIYCDAYMGPDGNINSKPLFPVEDQGVQGATDILTGQVRAWRDQQRAGWWIITKDSPGGVYTDPIIGHVTTGINIILDAIAKGKDYATAITIIDSGLVIID